MPQGSLRDRINKLVSDRDSAERTRDRLEASLVGSRQKHVDFEMMLNLVVEAANLTQLRFKNKTERAVTRAVRTVFPRDFRFGIDFHLRRKKSECDMWIIDRGYKRSMMSDMGCSTLDVTAIPLRLVIMGFKRPRVRPIVWMDEPLKWVGTAEEAEMAAELMARSSRENNIQVIVITHDPIIAGYGDAVFEVTHDGELSSVEQVAGQIVRAR